MADMPKPKRTRQSSGTRPVTLARTDHIATLLNVAKGKREPFRYTDPDSGEVLEDLGTGVLLDPSSLNAGDFADARPLRANSVRTMVYGVAKREGKVVSILDWTDGNFAIVIK